LARDVAAAVDLLLGSAIPDEEHDAPTAVGPEIARTG